MKTVIRGGGAITRMQGETFASFAARQKAAQKDFAKAVRASARKQKTRPTAAQTAAKRSADIVDGFNRDDI